MCSASASASASTGAGAVASAVSSTATAGAAPATPLMNASESRDPLSMDLSVADQASKLCSIGITPPQTLSVAEYRSLVKTLVCGVKTITWGLASCKSSYGDPTVQGSQSKMFQPKEILLFIDLVHWALEALDIYTITNTNGGAGTQVAKTTSTQLQAPRSKEEKEVLEHFSGVVSIAFIIIIIVVVFIYCFNYFVN